MSGVSKTRSRKPLLPFLTEVESQTLLITERDHGECFLRLCIQNRLESIDFQSIDYGGVH